MDKWIASSLRKQQEENPLPYELGAWEAFEKKRKAAKIKVLSYWTTGVAASLLLMLLAYNSMDFSNPSTQTPIVAGVETPQPNSGSNLNQEENISGNDANAGLIADASVVEKSENSGSKAKAGTSRNSRSSQAIQPELPRTENLSYINTQTTVTISKITESGEEEVISTEVIEESPKASLAMQLNSSDSDSIAQAKLEILKAQIAELTGEEEKPKSTDPSGNWNMALGVNPGFGSGQVDNRNITGSSLGIGLQMAMALNDKVSLGSGMGVNYFTQSNVGPSIVTLANAAYPVDETIEVQQVQVDVPIYVTYPVNRSRSITLQAGFSNLVAFNQSAKQESVYTRQVAVLDQESSFTNSISFRTESVSNLSTIETPASKFYPFATANLGVNFRILESKKTSYQVMPFYNYPIQDISGTGNNIGFFGASLKVNFGVIHKK